MFTTAVADCLCQSVYTTASSALLGSIRIYHSKVFHLIQGKIGTFLVFFTNSTSTGTQKDEANNLTSTTSPSQRLPMAVRHPCLPHSPNNRGGKPTESFKIASGAPLEN